MPAETVPAKQVSGEAAMAAPPYSMSVPCGGAPHSYPLTLTANSSPLSQAILHTLPSSTRPPSAPGDTCPSLGTHGCGMGHLGTPHSDLPATGWLMGSPPSP